MPSCSPGHPIGGTSMEFLAAAASDDEGGLFPDPPQQRGDSSSMLVVRDALLSQLHKDRLRQEIIMAELAKIERAVALRSADTQRAPFFSSDDHFFTPHSGGEPGAEHAPSPCALPTPKGLLRRPSDDAQRDNPVTFFSSNEHFTPHSGGAAGGEHNVGADDEVHDLKKKKDGVVHEGVELKPEKPAVENLAGECSKNCCGTQKAEGQDDAELSECKMQESSENMLPKKTPPSAVTWSCSICQAKATSEGNLQQHFAGQKHQSKVAALVSRKSANSQKATPTAEQASNMKQYAAEKPRPTWLCRFCQSKCTCKSDLENHLRGKRHNAKIQALLDECKNMAKNFGSTEVELHPHIVTRDEENPVSTWNCSLCQAKCTRQSELENHLKGKRHQLNFLVLQVEAQQYLSEWGCSICQAKCKSAFQFGEHCRGRGHQQKIEALLRGITNLRSSGFQAEKNPPSDGSNSKGKSSEETETQKTLYFCKLCNLHCNSKHTLAKHRQGKKHIEKVEKRMSSSYCEVCNLQCNSEKMLAHHCTGKTHLDKVNGC